MKKNPARVAVSLASVWGALAGAPLPCAAPEAPPTPTTAPKAPRPKRAPKVVQPTIEAPNPVPVAPPTLPEALPSPSAADDMAPEHVGTKPTPADRRAARLAKADALAIAFRRAASELDASIEWLQLNPGELRARVPVALLRELARRAPVQAPTRDVPVPAVRFLLHTSFGDALPLDIAVQTLRDLRHVRFPGATFDLVFSYIGQKPRLDVRWRNAFGRVGGLNLRDICREGSAIAPLRHPANDQRAA